jgi:hypothetical protein
MLQKGQNALIGYDPTPMLKSKENKLIRHPTPLLQKAKP